MTIIVILMAALVLACILILFVRSRRNSKMINKITLRYLKAMGYKHAQRKDGSTFNIEEQVEKDLQKEE